MNGKYISYLRVSTQKQGHSGLGLEAQRESVANYLNGGKWKLIQELVEVESGKSKDRPKLAEALRLCRIYNAKLLVANISRLARNVAFVSALMEAGVMFVAVDLPEANELTVHIMAAMAQHEAKAISARTKAALAMSKKPLGGLKWNLASVSGQGRALALKVRQEKASKRASDLIPVIEQIKSEGATSLAQIAAVLNDRGILPAREKEGSKWSAVQVMRVMKQA